MPSTGSPPGTDSSVTELDIVTLGEMLAVVEPADAGSGLAGAQSLLRSTGGAEVNVALTLARLGHHVGWVGAVGDDPFGRDGVSTLRGAGVDVSRVVVDRSAPTGVYFKEVLPLGELANHPYRAGSAASRVTVGDLDVDYLLSGRGLHLSGVTALISASGRELISHLALRSREAEVHLSVDANIRHRLLRDRKPAELLEPLMSSADTLFVSAAEARLLLGTDDPIQIQAQLASLVPTTVLVHNRHGAWAITCEDIACVAARAVDVVDPTGAGDAFAAGWLDDSPMAERLRRAEACAAYAVMSRGDNPADVPPSIRRAGCDNAQDQR